MEGGEQVKGREVTNDPGITQSKAERSSGVMVFPVFKAQLA